MTVSKPAQAGDYGIGMFFLPQDTLKRTFAIRMFEVIAQKEGLEVLGWRDVPVREQILGKAAVDCMPCIRQCFLARPADVERGIAFDRRLYVVRREFEQSSEDTYICSLSSRTIVYKGMFLVGQLRRFYDDLQSPDYVSAIAIVHSRFSTNTTPSWHRAHPYRMIALYKKQRLRRLNRGDGRAEVVRKDLAAYIDRLYRMDTDKRKEGRNSEALLSVS